ncbi:hypothetical protein LCGC14_1637230 [marine sediment metagenome]|uniref:Uncharacterized protein n=1 Tax=marine sediment metagenome TaxID=412755 RepID=A0A0F9KGH3_9ZZZZ
MAQQGWRDGHLRAKTVQLDQKRFVEDIYTHVLASSVVLIASADMSATASIYLGTTLDHPRTIKIVNDMQGEAERKAAIVIKGYTGQGEYAEETLTLSSAATGRTAGSVAFGHIISAQGDVATKGYGTYSSVSIYPANKFGVTEYIDDDEDIFQIQHYSVAGERSVSTSVISTTNVDKTNQTIDLTTLDPVASTLVISYKSKFQTRDKY